MNSNYNDDDEPKQLKSVNETPFWNFVTIVGLILTCISGLSLTSILFGASFSELKFNFIVFLVSGLMYIVGKDKNRFIGKK